MPNPWDSLPDAPPAAGSAPTAPWADLPDAPGGSPAVGAPAEPQLSGGEGVAAMMGQRPPMQAVAETTPEQSAQRLRVMAEIGVPAVAGLLLGPEAIPPARAGVTGLAALAPAAQALLVRMGLMGTAGTIGSELGQVFEPTAEDPGERRETAFALNAAGEPLAAGATTLAKGALPRVTELAENQMAKALGFNFASLMRVGREEARRVGRVALDNRIGRGLGLSSHETLLRRAEALQDDAGRTLGRIRDEVDTRGPGASADDIIAEIQAVLADRAPGPGAARPIVPGEADEPLLRGHLDRTVQDVEAFAREGARTAPVVGAEGNRSIWEATLPEMRQSAAMTPHIGPNQTAFYDIMDGYVDEIATAIRNGQQVPPQIVAQFEQLAELYPEQMNASALGALKRKFAQRAYGETGRVPETLMGELAPRTEAARAVVQDAEDRLVRELAPELAGDFQRGKDVYGAMERVTNPRTGVAEAAASRALGNNQVFGLSTQLSQLAGRTPAEGGLLALLSRIGWSRGNQVTAVHANRLASMLQSLTPEQAALVSRALMQGAGQAGRGEASPSGDRMPLGAP